MVSNWVEDKPPSDGCNLQENKEHRVENIGDFSRHLAIRSHAPFNDSASRSLRSILVLFLYTLI